MDNSIIESFIRKQKVAFICSVDEEGFPNVKAMLKPRKMEWQHGKFVDFTAQIIQHEIDHFEGILI